VAGIRAEAEGSNTRADILLAVPVPAAEPDHLRNVPLWSPKAGFSITAVLAVGVTVLVIEDGDDPVYDVEGELGEALELLSRDGLGGRQLVMPGEGDDLAHGVVSA
jgi:hypothetical protein